MQHGVRYWAVVPAAGSGKRMGSDRPKQYLRLGARMIIEHTLSRLRSYPRMAGIVVVISSEDSFWPTVTIPAGHGLLLVAQGGAERCHSVLNGLVRLREHARDDDWVMVHDAARPLVTHADIDALVQGVANYADGGLLALPVSDTVKRADAQQFVVQTVDRSDLWRALTPQLFPYAALHSALASAVGAGIAVTDESQAMERLGSRPRLVPGRSDNIKITRADDLQLAHWLLQQQE